MNKSFTDLEIAPPILQALEEMGFTKPTPVQSKVIPQVMKKNDLIVIAKTGSGKTAAFGIPMLQTIDPAAPGPRGLILTPTRELAVQVDHDLQQMAKHLNFKTTAIYGQHNMNLEIEDLKRGASIVTGTPGRVFDHIRQRTLVTSNVEFLVLDEADRMLDMGFIDQVTRIIKTLPKKRITLLFSATIPQEIQHICRQHMDQPEKIEIASPTKTVDTIEQIYYRFERNEKRTQLNRLLRQEQPESCLIFCNTRNEVDRVQEFLSRKGYASCALHGDIPQAKRLKTIHGFKGGKFHLLVATDVAARGIHIDDLALVINYDVPNERDNYVHRIGRTGRAGNGGKAITFVTSEDIMSLYEIEEHINAMIREEEPLAENESPELRENAEKWMKSKAIQHFESMPPRVAVKKPPLGKTTHPGEDRLQRSRTASEPPKSKYIKPVEPRETEAKNHPRPVPRPVKATSNQAKKTEPGKNTVEKKAPVQTEREKPLGTAAVSSPNQAVRKITAGTGNRNTVFAGKKSTESPATPATKKKGLLDRLLGKDK
jgi:superfamily II DNA/RNA helicase